MDNFSHDPNHQSTNHLSSASPSISNSAPPPSIQIGGLTPQINQINDLLLLPLLHPDLYAHFHLPLPRGIILHGPPGTGKTLLASRMASRTKAHVISLPGASLASAYHGETEGKLREIFQEAKEKAPAIIIVDEIDALVPRREEGGEVDRRVVATLLTEMDGIEQKDGVGGASVVVLATTNRINDIDPALRRPGRFDREIEIGIPDAPARLEILNALLEKTPHSLSPDFLGGIANKLHGYVGADIASLIRTAGIGAIQRYLSSTSSAPKVDLPISSNSSTQTIVPASIDHSGWTLDAADLEQAFLTSRPSAMREIFVETPKVSWDDIGGQSSNKRKLRQVVEWPLRYPDTFKRLGVKQPKGVLLFGPPGCSKTLIARAMACEAGVNFLSVKGPEIFSKYVGDSEKAIRETFRKARAAAPSIIFLDEIDAIASARGTDGEGGHSTSDKVLTSLLTEMDGIEELNGVTVLAATNRPEILDSAILRPGRLDRILYVGPPNLEARKEIVQISLRNMSVGPDVDVNALATMTEGCTGAEITSATQQAAFYAMEEDMDIPSIRQDHFVKAFRETKPRITVDTVRFYESWRDKIGTKEL
ncbi:AAA-domain-containing protein [Atractiella rhizophila]|nr:AAA-domain-containing protein [Atractiella rhizophila]